MKNLISATQTARASRPDLTMISVSVTRGKFRIVHFPTWETEKSPQPFLIKECKNISSAVSFLESM